MFQEALQETLVWRQLRHINVLEFLGLRNPMEDSGHFTLILPWLNNGNVQEFLGRVKDADRMSLVGPELGLTQVQRLKVL